MRFLITNCLVSRQYRQYVDLLKTYLKNNTMFTSLKVPNLKTFTQSEQVMETDCNEQAEHYQFN